MFARVFLCLLIPRSFGQTPSISGLMWESIQRASFHYALVVIYFTAQHSSQWAVCLHMEVVLLFPGHDLTPRIYAAGKVYSKTMWMIWGAA